MSLTFSYPAHLANYKDPHTKLTLVGQEEPRDPHNIPAFDAPRQSPVLYLPPLLSSLPKTLSASPIPPEHPPVITQTRLPDIDPVSLSLHKALHHFKPYGSDYGVKPYSEAFNWDQLVLPEHEEREWYCVVFRSKRKAGSDGDSLYQADKHAHDEAVRNGGLLLYWYGIPDQTTGMNLATCIWQSRKHAIAANSRPHHIQAMRLAAQSYEVYDLERHVLRKAAGSSGVTVETFTGGEVGW